MPTLTDVYDIVHGPDSLCYRPPDDGLTEVVHETGEHYTTFSRREDGSIRAYVELWHDEDPDHEEIQVDRLSLEQVRQIVDDPTTVQDPEWTEQISFIIETIHPNPYLYTGGLTFDPFDF